MATQPPNPKDSMKSTWMDSDRSEWTYAHRTLWRSLSRHPEYNAVVPVHAKTDPMPHMAQWSQHVFILTHALLPILLHQAVLSVTGWRSVSAWVVFPLYFFATLLMLSRQSLVMRYLGHVHGYLDGDAHARDGIPDVGVKKVFFEMYKMLFGRPLMTMVLTYQASQAPFDVMAQPRWWAWLAVQAGLYGIVLDFWFYWYHRAMHDVAPLWKFHRTHHLTKHPNPMLAGYADEEQELGDIFLVPLLTWVTMHFGFGMPFGFYSWWICQSYILYAEALGHSGLRIFLAPPSTLAWLLQYFDVALAIEDHDLHHRKGHRKSFNYGKQTRLWDKLFGTSFERYESPNVDYKVQAYMPFF